MQLQEFRQFFYFRPRFWVCSAAYAALHTTHTHTLTLTHNFNTAYEPPLSIFKGLQQGPRGPLGPLLPYMPPLCTAAITKRCHGIVCRICGVAILLGAIVSKCMYVPSMPTLTDSLMRRVTRARHSSADPRVYQGTFIAIELVFDIFIPFPI